MKADVYDWSEIDNSKVDFMHLFRWLYEQIGESEVDWWVYPAQIEGGIFQTRVCFARSTHALLFTLAWSATIVRSGQEEIEEHVSTDHR